HWTRAVEDLSVAIPKEGTSKLGRMRSVAWQVPFAHGTPTMKRWSFDVRSYGPNQATLEGRYKLAWRDYL
ncbi:MAG: hypothetical protein KGJ82_21405, partial [Nitrospirota bacterium]|nr:hypothetical protein [Nitrospirota bacterium]